MNAFDRTYARGPWRILPVPAHLADDRAGLTFQLSWAGGLAALVAATSWIANGMLDGRVFQEPGQLLAQSLPLLLTAIGMAVVFAKGGFDLSVGAITSLAAIIAAKTDNPWLALVAALACGVANGALVGLLRVPGWLVTAFTVVLIHRINISQLMGLQHYRLRDPSSMDWALSIAPFVAILAAVVAFVWTQLRPAPAGKGRLHPFLADAVLPYLFSAALAAMAGFSMAARVQGAGTGPSEWLDLGLAVVVGGTFLGAGRANVAGVVVASLGVGALRYVLLSTSAQSGGVLKHALLLLALAVSLGIHALAARRFARSRAAEPAPARPDPGRTRHFARALFQGPGRSLPVPLHLADRRWALRLELGWSLVLLAAVAAFIVPAARGGDAGWASFSFLGPQLVVPLLLALGACAVVARGGFDFSALAVLGIATQIGALRGEPWLALVAAVAVGLVNGGLVALLRVPGWIVTFATAFLVQLASSRLLGVVRVLRLSKSAMSWVPTASVVLLVAAAIVAIAWLQLAAGRSGGRASPWRERLADALPYLFSSGLAGVAGVYLLARMTNLEGQLTAGDETFPVLIVAGCWLGAGRANVVGVLLAVVGIVSVEFQVMTWQKHQSVVLAVLAAVALAGLVASRVVHLWAGWAYSRRPLQGSSDGTLASAG